MAEGNDLKLKIDAAAEPACDRGRERRQKRDHARDVMAAQQKTPAFSTRAGFSAGTAVGPSCFSAMHPLRLLRRRSRNV